MKYKSSPYAQYVLHRFVLACPLTRQHNENPFISQWDYGVSFAASKNFTLTFDLYGNHSLKEWLYIFNARKLFSKNPIFQLLSLINTYSNLSVNYSLIPCVLTNRESIIAVLEATIFFFLLPWNISSLRLIKNPYEPNRCQQVILIINFI